MTDSEVEIEVQKNEMEEIDGRRRSVRNQGKKVCYTDKGNIPTYDQDQMPLKRCKQQVKKFKSAPPSAPVVSDAMVNSIPEESIEEGDGLMKLGFHLEEVNAGNSSEKSDHLKVKETRRAFNNYYLHHIQEEEKRCQKVEGEVKKKTNGETEKTKSKRPDLKATKMMRDAGKILHSQKQFGHIPGVDVGHQFFSRAEMVAVGFHSHWLNGIDYVGKSNCKELKGDFSNYEFPLTVAIVMSGQYEDDLDNSEDVIYTGQGGHDLLGNKKQIKDQKMESGNLALKNSMKAGLPVRVIRGHPSKSSYVGKVYTYDGLYNVTPCLNSLQYILFVALLAE